MILHTSILYGLTFISIVCAAVTLALAQDDKQAKQEPPFSKVRTYYFDQFEDEAQAYDMAFPEAMERFAKQVKPYGLLKTEKERKFFDMQLGSIFTTNNKEKDLISLEIFEDGFRLLMSDLVKNKFAEQKVGGIKHREFVEIIFRNRSMARSYVLLVLLRGVVLGEGTVEHMAGNYGALAKEYKKTMNLGLQTPKQVVQALMEEKLITFSEFDFGKTRNKYLAGLEKKLELVAEKEFRCSPSIYLDNLQWLKASGLLSRPESELKLFLSAKDLRLASEVVGQLRLHVEYYSEWYRQNVDRFKEDKEGALAASVKLVRQRHWDEYVKKYLQAK